MTTRQFFIYIVSIPKTLYFNFKVLPFSIALKMPFFVAWNVKLANLKKNIVEFECEIKPFTVAIGFNGTPEVSPSRAYVSFRRGKVLFRGKCNIAEGCIIDVSCGGKLVFGKNFSANKNFFVSCNKEIVFGDDCMLGWNVLLFDATGHVIYKDEVQKDSFKPIYIGNHVWLCAEVHVMKGSSVADGSVVGYRSLVTSKFSEQNILIAGNPAKFVQNAIQWGNFKDLNNNYEKN